MQKFAWVGVACAIGVAAMAACTSSTNVDGGDDGSSGVTPTKDGGAFTRDGSVYDSSPSPESGLGQLLFRPNAVYTGTDGSHTFKVPIAVYDADSDLAVTSSDGSAMTITKTTLVNPVSPDGVTDNGKYFLVTALKPGSYTLTATSKGRSTTASLTISAYLPARYGTGAARYNDGITTMTADRECKSCHVNGMAIDHSPAALATATDQDVGVIITTGVKPGPGGPSVIKIPSEPGTQHKWTVTDDEREGLVTYLRALDPRGFR